MNFLPTNGFRVAIKRLPGLEYYAQRVQLPDESVGMIERGTPFMSLKVPGDSVAHGPLTVTFKVDEELKNYVAVRDWMMALARETDWEQYRRLENGEGGLVSDLTVVAMNSQRNRTVDIEFRDVFPVALGSLTLDATLGDAEYSTVDVTFEHNGFTVRPAG